MDRFIVNCSKMHVRLLFVLCTTVLVCVFGSAVGPQFPPTHGEVWPKPQHEDKKDTFYTFSPAHFAMNVANNDCEILKKAIWRYVPVLSDQFALGRRHWRKALKKTGRRHVHPRNISHAYLGLLRKLDINLTQPCEEFPYFEMDESYNLTVSETSLLTSKSIWGILRGLESFAQLFYITKDFTEIRINSTHIVDYPRYPHRGLMLDTGRHYLSMANILKTLDAMVMNKMNVLHWHIVDDQSFPYASQHYPKLSEKAAFHRSMVYTKSDIRMVVQYAKYRGIRVVPEFDVPGHTRSWGVAYPELVVQCNTGVLNPTKNFTYKLIKNLFDEVQEWFPDDHFHVGADEVDENCWSSNPQIKKYMKEHNITNRDELFAMFIKRVTPLLKQSTKVIAWQDVFDLNLTRSSDFLFQVWRNGGVGEMVKILKAGHRLLFSSTWYLDRCYGYTFDKMYKADPRQIVGKDVNETLLENIYGGEACMWGEMVDDRNLMSTVWPRASAVAEVLWSPPQSTSRVSDWTHSRIEEHACRMVRRGVPSEPPNGPGFCVTD